MEEVTEKQFLREYATAALTRAREVEFFPEKTVILLEGVLAMLMAIYDRPRELRAGRRKKRDGVTAPQ